MKKTPFNTADFKCALVSAFLLCGFSIASSSSATSLTDLESAIQKNQWDDSAEIAYEILLKDPGASAAKLKGAYGLFQKGYTHSALAMLKRLTPDEWRRLPEGQNRLVEIIALFQKKVPLDILPGRLEQLEPSQVAPWMRNEIQFARGRAAFEKKHYKEAQALLEQVGVGSRFYVLSRYLIATIASEKGDYKIASENFSAIFEPIIFEQSGEFWKDISAQMSSHWGPSFKVILDTEGLLKSSQTGELAMLGLARVAYGAKDFPTALERYAKISPASRFYPKASLEQIWTLLALNRHDDAQRAAATLSTTLTDERYESIEARSIRALILTDAGMIQQARDEIQSFNKAYEAAKSQLDRFKGFQLPENLPTGLKHDLDEDVRVQVLERYQTDLKNEIEKLHAEDTRLFPVYSRSVSDLQQLSSQAKALSSKLTQEHVARRLADLERLFVQSKLILAETFLEEREQLRREYQGMADVTEIKQKEHDIRLVSLLSQAVQEVDSAMQHVTRRHLNLEFRQSELLWELGTARAILSQTVEKKANEEKSDDLKRRSIRIAEDIAEHFPTFKKHAEALFFTGFAKLDMGNVAGGEATLLRFVSAYPRHHSSADAYRILADARFDSNQFGEAEKFYKKVLEFTDSPVLGYALYKIGWCAYNEKNYGKALLALEQAVLWAGRLDKTNQLLSLKREARRDLVAIYAEVGDHKKAQEYFQRFLQGETLEWLSDLGNQLEAMGQFEKSNEVFQTLITLDPSNKENLAYQTSIIRGYFKLRHWPQVLQSSKDLIDRYGALLVEPQPNESPIENAEKIMREAALGQLLEFTRADDASGYERALQLDKLYLNTFSKWPTSQQPLYQDAYLLGKQKRWPEAAQEFETHWLRFQTDLKEPLRDEALRNLIHSLEETENKIKSDSAELSKTAGQIIKYTDEYLQKYPAAKQARGVSALRTAIFFKYKQLSSGISESQKLFDANPSDEIGKQSFKNLRLAYYERKQWEPTFHWATEMLARTSPAMAAYTADLKTVREESLFLWAEGTEDNEKAAELFLKVAHDPEMKRLKEKGLYNAFVRLHKADKKQSALNTAIELDNAGQKLKEFSAIQGIRAALYQEAGDYVRALSALEKFLVSPPKETPQNAIQQARFNAGLIAEALGNYDKALVFFQTYLDKSGGEKGAALADAKSAIERIRFRQPKRGVAAVDPAGWNGLLKKKADLERLPIPKKGDLAHRIEKGLLQLETLAKEFFAFSSSANTPTDSAFEAYCSVPFLYVAFSEAVGGLGKKGPADLVTELNKVRSPLDQKAKEIAEECLKKSEVAEHDGPNYQKVSLIWGWKKEAAVRMKVSSMIEILEKGQPWLDPAPLANSESELIDLHLNNAGTPDSWYSLGMRRLETGRFGLSRLTFIDALVKTPDSPRLLNVLAYLHLKTGGAGSSSLFEKAGSKGAGLAWVNEALLHLAAGRLERGKESLRHAVAAQVFVNHLETEKAVQEFIGP